MFLAHMFKTLPHKPFHKAISGIFRIGAYTGHKSYRIDCAIDIHFQWVYGNLGYKRAMVEATQHIRTLQNREFGLLNFIITPTADSKVLLSYLEA